MKLIVISGMDGAGKTTLQANLLQAIEGTKKEMLHLPYSSFVYDALKTSGGNSAFGDSWTDRLIFALDNRLVDYKLKELSQNMDYVVMQRGWMDSFICGAVQGYAYEEMAALNKVDDLIQPDCTIYLNCESKIAYSRIADDPMADKFETPDYMIKQFKETKRFYDELAVNPLLRRLFPEANLYIDTTHLTPEQVFEQVVSFLDQKGLLALSKKVKFANKLP